MDALRSPARIVDGRIVPFCVVCAAPPAAPVEAVSAAEPSARVLRPRRHQAASLLARLRLPPRASLIAGAAAALTLLVFRSGNAGPQARLALPPVGKLTMHAAGDVQVQRPPAMTPEPTRTPELVHPLPGPTRLLPENSSRVFGAVREGVRHRECGHGHCGVDIGDEIGAPVVAVRDGVVTRVVRGGNDDNGGLFVRIEHQDGTLSGYFHLQRIRPDLRRGSLVRAGEQIGTLGRSGIFNGPAHLHFAISTRDGDYDRYFDPVAMLRDATVLETPLVYPLPAPVVQLDAPDAPVPSVSGE